MITFGNPRLSVAWPPEPPKESPRPKSPFLPILASAFTRVDSLGGSGGVRPLTNVGPQELSPHSRDPVTEKRPPISVHPSSIRPLFRASVNAWGFPVPKLIRELGMFYILPPKWADWASLPNRSGRHIPPKGPLPKRPGEYFLKNDTKRAGSPSVRARRGTFLKKKN